LSDDERQQAIYAFRASVDMALASQIYSSIPHSAKMKMSALSFLKDLKVELPSTLRDVIHHVGNF